MYNTRKDTMYPKHGKMCKNTNRYRLDPRSSGLWFSHHLLRGEMSIYHSSVGRYMRQTSRLKACKNVNLFPLFLFAQVNKEVKEIYQCHISPYWIFWRARAGITFMNKKMVSLGSVMSITPSQRASSPGLASDFANNFLIFGLWARAVSSRAL